ncbi:fatty acyl-CoA synthetase [Allobacillus halotolerans]|uniref:Long-chain-fatty-acid--CoA ligase n=1 Tax=Allobacillus halotolerans TaxID=570278 RepID=A0ABS6GQ77_9BACI|nr:fatty acyl-CoA synthetase [Allobacillus halotolerans]MBU6081238.1 long-chain-fatty-acid--CoA ligase [Allobacillus halotolerans]
MRSNTIAETVKRTAKRTPHHTAIIYGERTWTYEQLDQAVTSVALELQNQGVNKGERVAAYGKNSDLYVLLYLAAVRLGAIHVPVNFQLKGAELDYILSDSDPTLVVADRDLASEIEKTENNHDQEVIYFEDHILAWTTKHEDSTEVAFEVEDTDVAQLLYTSGTTSNPKGAIMTHRALVHHYVSCIQGLDIKESDRALHSMPLYHSAQMHVFMLPALMVGGWNKVLKAPVPDQVLQSIEEDEITSFFAAPTAWVSLANHPDFTKHDLSTLKKAYYGASIMPGPILERLQNHLPELGFYNVFGQSEMGPACTVLLPEEHEDRPGSAGRPLIFVETRVVDSEGKDVAVGELGEIVYRSPHLCLGYWNKPEATSEAFRDGWFHSGDLVKMDEEGYIEVIDRVKDVINTGGVVVASREIEDCIYELPQVAEVAVVGVPDERWIEAVTAFVVTKDQVTEDEIIQHVKDNLASFKVPKHVELVDKLPRNASGKILKRQLRDAITR